MAYTRVPDIDALTLNECPSIYLEFSLIDYHNEEYKMKEAPPITSFMLNDVKS